MAAEGCTRGNFVFGGVDAETDEYFACNDIEVVGWGGRSFANGNDATDSTNGNCRVVVWCQSPSISTRLSLCGSPVVY